MGPINIYMGKGRNSLGTAEQNPAAWTRLPLDRADRSGGSGCRLTALRKDDVLVRSEPRIEISRHERMPFSAQGVIPCGNERMNPGILKRKP